MHGRETWIQTKNKQTNKKKLKQKKIVTCTYNGTQQDSKVQIIDNCHPKLEKMFGFSIWTVCKSFEIKKLIKILNKLFSLLMRISNLNLLHNKHNKIIA